MELLRAGIPVLGEKPISNNLEEAREMVALARAKRVRYGINLNHRFTPAALMAREWIDQGRLGEINIINMTMWINNPNETSPWFHIRALHPHSLDVMRYFAGDVDKVQAFFKKGKGRTIWSNVQVNLLFKSGVIGHLTGSYDAGGSYGLERLDVVGSEARFVLLDACEHLTFYPRSSRETVTYDYVGGMMGFGETFASRGQKMIYHGPLKPLESLLLRSPIVPWSYAASQAYYDGFWYPFIGYKRVRDALDTKWGALFREYGNVPAVTKPLYEPKTAAAGILGVAASALALLWLLNRGKKES